MNREFGLANKNGGGFFSNFFVSLSLALDAEKDNLIPYVILDKTIFTKYSDYKGDANSWNWWFDQEIPDSNDTIIKLNYVNDNNFIYFPPPFYYNAVDKSEVFSKKWNRAEVDKSILFFNKYFKIKKHILQQTEDFYQKYLNGKVNLGVMARGTEFNLLHPQYGNQSVHDYINTVRDILKKQPEIDNIFLVTEDNDYVNLFKNTFDNVLVMDVFRRTTQSLEYCKYHWEWPYQGNPRPNHTKILGDECLSQTLILGKCDYLICKENSMSAGALFFKENIKNVYYV